MHPLTTAAALLLDRWSPGLDAPRAAPWASRYLALMREQFGALEPWGALVPVLFLIAVPLALATFLLYAAHALGALLGAALGLLLMLVAFGPQGGLREIEAYPDALEQDDDAAATTAATAVIGARPLPVPVERSRAFARAVPQAVLQSSFGVATWALIAGPIGALLWRTAEQLERALRAGPPAQHAEARRVLGVLAWLPTRALALTLAAMGRGEEAFAEWRAFRAPEAAELRDADAELLARVAHAALKVDPDEEDGGLHLAWCAVALAERAWLAWVAALVVLGLIGVVA